MTFQVDADGLLSVTAMEKSTGVESSIRVKPSYGLTDSEIASMIQDSMSLPSRTLKPVCWQNRKSKRHAYWKVYPVR
ncbi:Hsp70 family protein [Shigella flexneri]